VNLSEFFFTPVHVLVADGAAIGYIPQRVFLPDRGGHVTKEQEVMYRIFFICNTLRGFSEQ
jgi:hypothetical protein